MMLGTVGRRKKLLGAGGFVHRGAWRRLSWQLVVRFRDPAGVDDEAHTRSVTARVIEDGVCYPSITTWRGVAGMRISVSNWSTDEDDVRRSIDATARAHRLPAAQRRP
jgi:hypothetical protein